jgi:hypothetical protein
MEKVKQDVFPELIHSETTTHKDLSKLQEQYKSFSTNVEFHLNKTASDINIKVYFVIPTYGRCFFLHSLSVLVSNNSAGNETVALYSVQKDWIDGNQIHGKGIKDNRNRIGKNMVGDCFWLQGYPAGKQSKRSGNAMRRCSNFLQFLHPLLFQVLQKMTHFRDETRNKPVGAEYENKIREILVMGDTGDNIENFENLFLRQKVNYN